MNDTEFLREAFSGIGIRLTDMQTAAFLRYYELLTERNKVMNLTAITDYEDVVVKHFADSAALFSPLFLEKLGRMEINRAPALIDVGTGAGFPGLPLAVVKPEAKVFLLDALRKRIDFLKELSSDLKLANVSVLHSRAEDGVQALLPALFAGPEQASPAKARGFFDIAVSRAVSDLSVLAEYCLPYVRVGGVFAAYKSADSDEEIRRAEKAVEILGGEIAETVDFTLPLTDEPRRIILIRKNRETPEKYPRKAGKPEKKPLS